DDLLWVRRLDAEPDPVQGAERVHHLVGLLGQPAGVEGDDLRPFDDTRGEVDEHRGLGLEARDQGHAAMVGVGPAQDLLGRGALEIGQPQGAAHATGSRNRSRRVATPERWHQSPKPSPGARSPAKAVSGPRSSDGISSKGTLRAKSSLRRVPSKSPPRKTSYLPRVVPTNPTSPR